MILLRTTITGTVRGIALSGALLMAGGLLAARPASADPPGHAPAHGWRRDHDDDWRTRVRYDRQRDFDRDRVPNWRDPDDDNDRIPDWMDRHDRTRVRTWHRYGGYWGDLDRDGIRNGRDWDVDGDRIPNGRDRDPFNRRVR